MIDDLNLVEDILAKDDDGQWVGFGAGSNQECV